MMFVKLTISDCDVSVLDTSTLLYGNGMEWKGREEKELDCSGKPHELLNIWVELRYK